MLTIRVTDSALAAIASSLGTVPPEQGGAMLGAAGADVVTSFIHDAPAVVSRARYHNSDWLLETIAERERARPERFKGIVHSHPGGMPGPSSQDCHEFGESLRRNPELGRYLAAIVTLTPDLDPAEHQLVLGDALFSFFGASWIGEELRLFRMRPAVMPIDQSLARAGFDPAAHQPVPALMDGSLVLGSRITLTATGEATLLFLPDFPLVPPTLVPDGRSQAIPLSWDLSLDAPDRLATALMRFSTRRSQPGPAAPAPGTVPSQVAAGVPPQADQPAAIRSARGQPDGNGQPGQRPAAKRPRRWLWFGKSGTGRQRNGSRANDPAGADEPASAALFARTGGVLSTEVSGKRVLIAGVGSVGSYLAEICVRSGVGAVTLIDPDIVETVNLGRTIFTAADVGAPKTGACAQRLRTINPAVAVTAMQAEIGTLRSETLLSAIREADLVIAATDDNAAQQRLNHLAYWAGIPAIFVGLYEGAAGGEVIVVREGLACWECATVGVRDTVGAVSVQPATNYGTGRLTAVPGLLTDIHLVSAAAGKMALALLHTPGDPARVSRFLDRPFAGDENYALFGTEPDYWFFPQVFGETLGQHAFQSVWLRAPRRPDCPVCGPAEGRTDPLAYATSGSEEERIALGREAYRKREQARAGRER